MRNAPSAGPVPVYLTALFFFTAPNEVLRKTPFEWAKFSDSAPATSLLSDEEELEPLD
jgi:hypothetical protein